MKQFISAFSIWEISIVGAKFTKGLRRSVHLVLLHCHLLGTRGDSVWCPDSSYAQTLSWSCKETSWDRQDTQSWRDGSTAEDDSSLSSTPLRCFIAPQEHWPVIWQRSFPQHAMGPFHRESAQDIQVFLTNLQMYGVFTRPHKNGGQAATTGHSFDMCLWLRADPSPCPTALPSLASLCLITCPSL